MKLDVRFLIIYTSLVVFILLLVSTAFYHYNPYGNTCIRGDCRSGYGIHTYGSGLQYEGEWKNGKRDGQGTLTYPDGSQYTGTWKNNRMHGHGIKIYASDRQFKKYTGEWKNGNKHGKGTILYLGGEQYEGEWKQGAIDGKGIYTAHNGRTIQGQWKNGMAYGQVTERFPDGRILVVNWENGRRNGRGTMTYPDGTEITGEWINNKLIGSADFYLFRYVEFDKPYSISRLCGAIRRDTLFTTETNENIVQCLNEFLKMPGLYEKLNRKIRDKKLPDEINALLQNTNDISNRKFSELNTDRQKAILKFNRLLLEYLYPKLVPKS
jgi:hypothetical protein